MQTQKPHRLLAPDFQRLNEQFLIPAAIAAVAAALTLLESSDYGVVLLIAAAAWPAALAASLFAQSRGASRRVGVAAQLGAGAAMALLVLAGKAIGLAVPYYFAGLALLCLAAPALRLWDPDSYWVWAERFCVAALFSAAIASVGFAASTATLFSAEHLFHLFGASLASRLMAHLAAIFFIGVGPIAYLAIQPPIADEALATDERDFVRRAIAGLGSWALAPFVLIYSALLWVYAGKIALDRALPDGQIGWMVGAFGFSALATVFLIAPQRRDGPAQTRLLWRIWPTRGDGRIVFLLECLYINAPADGDPKFVSMQGYLLRRN